MDDRRSFDHVLIIGFGAPASPEEVRPFLDAIGGGRIPQDRLESVAKHYEAIGGSSPYNARVGDFVHQLHARLHENDLRLPVLLGMRNWNPYLTDAVGEAKRLGLRRGLGVVLAPHRSPASFGRYVKSVEEAQERAGAAGIGYEYLDAWHDHPLFIGAHAAALEEAIKAAGLKSPGEAEIVFTAHSIPVDMARASAYESEMRDTAARIAKAVHAPSWSVAWQSASVHGGSAGSPRGGTGWLEPDIVDVIKGIGRQSSVVSRRSLTTHDSRLTTVVVAPVGFLCDNAEILYDLDIEVRRAAESAGIRYFRANTVLNHPNVVEMFTQLIKNKVGERSTVGGEREPPTANR